MNRNLFNYILIGFVDFFGLNYYIINFVFLVYYLLDVQRYDVDKDVIFEYDLFWLM